MRAGCEPWPPGVHALQGGVVNLTRNEYNGQQYEGDWAVRGRKVLLLEKRW